jgi:MFS family permease
MLGIHQSAAPSGIALGPIIVGLAIGGGLGWSQILGFSITPLIIIIPLLILNLKKIVEPDQLQKTIQKTTSTPFPKSIFILITSMTIAMGSSLAFQWLIPLYLTKAHQVTSSMAALIFGITNLTGIAGQLISGFLSDIIGRIKVILVSVSATALLILVAIQLPFGLPLLIVLFLIAGFQQAFFPAQMTLISDITSPSERAKILGLIQGIGSILGMSSAIVIVGYLTDVVGFKIAFLYSVIAPLIAIPIILKLKPKYYQRIAQQHKHGK